ncbi:hypothetical protein CLF_102572 [Clonorchis sinensis]|uniref:Uncharacterized protein n=1 Tax=Clonorchis sinensis TaxID=79923 RepID=G7Y853_CLOSI|nr:hypothetical protein CLF_102572 [Clonorchis sinensis]
MSEQPNSCAHQRLPQVCTYHNSSIVYRPHGNRVKYSLKHARKFAFPRLIQNRLNIFTSRMKLTRKKHIYRIKIKHAVAQPDVLSHTRQVLRRLPQVTFLSADPVPEFACLDHPLRQIRIAHIHPRLLTLIRFMHSHQGSMDSGVGQSLTGQSSASADQTPEHAVMLFCDPKKFTHKRIMDISYKGTRQKLMHVRQCTRLFDGYFDNVLLLWFL